MFLYNSPSAGLDSAIPENVRDAVPYVASVEIQAILTKGGRPLVGAWRRQEPVGSECSSVTLV